jgi:hypothetical protein
MLREETDRQPVVWPLPAVGVATGYVRMCMPADAMDGWKPPYHGTGQASTAGLGRYVCFRLRRNVAGSLRGGLLRQFCDLFLVIAVDARDRTIWEGKSYFLTRFEEQRRTIQNTSRDRRGLDNEVDRG